jgi:hypothetical protein
VKKRRDKTDDIDRYATSADTDLYIFLAVISQPCAADVLGVVHNHDAKPSIASRFQIKHGKSLRPSPVSGRISEMPAC